MWPQDRGLKGSHTEHSECMLNSVGMRALQFWLSHDWTWRSSPRLTLHIFRAEGHQDKCQREQLWRCLQAVHPPAYKARLAFVY